MIAIDTNILVRLLTRDDEPQFKKALTLFEQNDIFIPDTVILESEWVLRFAYEFTPQAVCGAFNKLFGLPNVNLTNANQIAQALQWHEQGLEFSDAMHLALSQHHDQFFTFDGKFARKAKGLCKCSVVEP